LNVTLVNEEAARLFGVEREEILGASLQDALAKVGDENATANFFAACTALEPSAFDAYDPRSDRFLEVRAYPGEEGTTLHLRDVTALRRAEYERQRSEARFRSLVQEASDLILILDRQAVIQFASPAVVRMLGLEPWEIVGRDDALIVHPADDKRFRRSLVRILRTPGIHTPFEVRVRHRDGSYRWLEITPTNLLSDPLIRGVVANCRDITERHASEFNLWLTSEVSTVMGATLELDQTLEALNRLLVTYTCEISLVAVFNERGEVERYAGAEREPNRSDFRADGVLAERAVEAIGVSSGRPLSSRHTVVVDVARLDDEDPSSPYAQLGGRMKELELASAIIVPIVLRGQVRGLLMVGFGQDAEITPALISMIEDVARRAGLAIENAGLYLHAREAIEARDRFLSVTAHELRTPITSVTGYSKMLMRELRERKDPDRIVRYAGRLDEAGHRLATLAEDLLDVSRIRSGQLPLRMGPVDLGALASQIAVRYTEHRSSARDRINVQVDEPSPAVSADPDRLEQVVTNIIDNALKYSPPQTTIDLLVTADNHDAMVVIRDQGMGVAPDSLEAIFEPFGRGGNVEETGITGLGLGLYICRTIVERLGGTIRAESEGEGTGLTVTVRLPLINETSDAE
jgi:PAS domain S-box-containing protein